MDEEDSENKFGFIITRHVNSEKTNKYWNLCVCRIRKFYSNKIVIIDDNSNTIFLKADFEYKNVEYVQSEFIGRGELLPYYYFYKNKYFENAVIIHDSVFIHKKLRFNKFILPVIPIWHFDNLAKWENVSNSINLSSVLKNKNIVQKKLKDQNILNNITNKNENWIGCFGLQCFINHSFLVGIQNKYEIFNLLRVVKNRSDRCCLERIMGIIFSIEFPELIKIKSLFGNIVYKGYGYSFENYINDLNKYKRSKYAFVKVWTGR
jgi:hypothetical protein